MARGVKVELWERQPREGMEVYKDFCVYRDMGPSRTIPQAAQILGKNVTALWQTSARYKWVKRAEAYDDYNDRKHREVMEKQMLQVKEASITGAMKMVSLGLKKLNTIDADDLTVREAKEYIRNALAIVQSITGENKSAEDAVMEMPNENDVVVYLPEIEDVVTSASEAAKIVEERTESAG